MAEVGRPNAITEDKLRKLDFYFAKGLTDAQACLLAEIAPSTLYLYCKENPEYSERKESLKESPKIKAKINIAESIEGGNLYDSRWYLERTDKEFNPKSQVDVGNKDGETFKTESKTDLSKLSVEELRNLAGIIRKASVDS